MHSNAKVLEVGHRFERLVVTGVSSIRRGREVQFECACDCGKSILAVGSHLRGGVKTSCGCLHRERVSSSKFNQIESGEKFGRLTVLDVAEQGIGKKSKYRCLCDCGNEIAVFGVSLRQSRQPTRSCGCLMRETTGNSFRTHGQSRTKEYKAQAEMLRQARKLMATPAWASAEKISEIYWHAECLRRSGQNVQVDHIVPLRGKNVCGLHVESNLQILNKTKNQSKGNRFEA